MENNVVCKAKFKSMCLGLIIAYVILFCLVNYLAFDTKYYTSYEVDKRTSAINSYLGKPGLVYDYNKKPEYKEELYRLWGRIIASYTYDVREDVNRSEGFSWNGDYYVVILGFLIVPPLLLIPFFKSKSKKSKLELTDEGINGINIKMFSTGNIKLPIDKVESAFVKKNLYNILTGGKTIVICSNTGKYKFPWVQNADEFVDATLEKIK